jgi:retinol dehydrogenase 14
VWASWPVGADTVVSHGFVVFRYPHDAEVWMDSLEMTRPMTGRICLITGATSGIGRHTAGELARMGAHVVLVARDPRRGQETRAELIETAGHREIEVFRADLAVQDDIRGLAAEFRDRYDRLDVLVNNAGLYATRHELTVDGVETTFAVNHLAPFLLTNLLREVLVVSAPSRVVTVASMMHKAGRIDFDDLSGQQRWSVQRAYNQSKLANVLFTRELARRLDGTRVTANCCHPGTVRSNFGAGSTGLSGVAMAAMRPFMMTPARGADTVVYLASAPEVATATGGYYVRRRLRRSSRGSYDKDTARRLWEVSAELTGLAVASPS